MEELIYSKKPTITKKDLLKVLDKIPDDDALITMRYRNFESSIQEINTRPAYKEDWTETKVIELILTPDDNITNFITKEKSKEYLKGMRRNISEYEEEIKECKEKLKRYKKNIAEMLNDNNSLLKNNVLCYRNWDYLEKIIDEKYFQLDKLCRKNDRKAIKEMDVLMNLIDILNIAKK